MGEKHVVPEPPNWYRTTFPILGELSGTLGSVLWQYARHLRDWCDCAPDERATLFPPETPGVRAKRAEAKREAPELAPALDRFGVLMAAPLAGPAGDVAEACREVAEWARARGAPETAIHYAELAALCDPSAPALANLAGRLTRDAAEFARAEVWFERAIGLARRTGDHVEYTRAHLGSGILWKTVGKVRRARKHLHTASIIARKDGRAWLAAEAQHDLMLMTLERGYYGDAEQHGRKALGWYPKHHARFPYFAADVALLLILRAHYAAAVRLIDEFLRRVPGRGERVIALALLARAAAGAGDRTRAVWADAQALEGLEVRPEYEPAVRIHLAEAERTAGFWSAAEANARLALQAAAQRDPALERIARALLDGVAARVPAAPEAARGGSADSLTLLAEAVHARLAAWSPTRRGRLPGLARDQWAA